MASCADGATARSASSLTSNLAINIEDLLKCQGVEKQRVEFKERWNTGPTKIQVVKTISAFANDFYNDNGGYIVIGVKEDDSDDAVAQIELPPVGVPPRSLDKFQKQIMGACKGLMRPEYSPILSPEIVEGKHVLVIWAQASENRPHKAKESEKGEFHYFIRKGVETTKATEQEIKVLMESSQKIPFDDRMARHRSGIPISYNAIGRNLVMEFLDNIRSNLERNLKRITLERMNLVVRCGDVLVNGHLTPRLVPKNVALLMFNHTPFEYFHGAKIEVAMFSRDNEVLEEHPFAGPLQKQINESIDLVLRTTNREKSVSSVTYPRRALREAIVNAMFHRGYEPEHNSPTKINIRQHCLEVWSYPGPHPSLKPEHFTTGKDVPQVPARNRRIGEFLKDLKLAEARGTGVKTIFKTMKKNKNPDPKFDFDSAYFRVTLPAHPKFEAMMLLKDVEELEVKGNKYQASEMLQQAFDENPSIINQSLIQKLISLHDGHSDHPVVQKYAPHIETTTSKRCSLLQELKKWLADNPRNYISRGVQLVNDLVKVDAEAQDLEGVTEFAHGLSKERSPDTRKSVLQSNRDAHQLFDAYGHEIVSSHSTIAYYFACVKYNIFTLERDRKRRRGFASRNATKGILTYLTDAENYLDNAILMPGTEEKPHIRALYHRQLGYIRYYLLLEGKETVSAYKICYEKARQLDPKVKINRLLDPADGVWSVHV